MTTPEDEYRRTYNMYHKPQPKKRTGKTPEAKVSADIDKYLKRIGALALRTSAGLIEKDGRKIQIGQAGTSDRTCCIAGVFVAIEIKAGSNMPTQDQLRYLQRVKDAGGLAIVAWSVSDLRSALIEKFGEQQVKRWELDTV